MSICIKLTIWIHLQWKLRGTKQGANWKGHGVVDRRRLAKVAKAPSKRESYVIHTLKGHSCSGGQNAEHPKKQLTAYYAHIASQAVGCVLECMSMLLAESEGVLMLQDVASQHARDKTTGIVLLVGFECLCVPSHCCMTMFAWISGRRLWSKALHEWSESFIDTIYYYMNLYDNIWYLNPRRSVTICDHAFGGSGSRADAWCRMWRLWHSGTALLHKQRLGGPVPVVDNALQGLRPSFQFCRLVCLFPESWHKPLCETVFRFHQIQKTCERKLCSSS